MRKKVEAVEADTVPVDVADWPRALAELMEVIESAIRRKRSNAVDTREIAIEVTLEIAQFAGGRQLYIPRGDVLKRILRDTEIFRRSGKESAANLSREFGVTGRQVHRIIVAQRELVRKSARDTRRA